VKPLVRAIVAGSKNVAIATKDAKRRMVGTLWDRE
jgi:hypothetical protein